MRQIYGVYALWGPTFNCLKHLHMGNHELTAVLVAEKYYICIHTHAFVALTITESVKRAVIIWKTFHFEASHSNTVWVSKMSSWTWTDSNMVKNVTNSIRSTLDTCTCYTGICALPILAHQSITAVSIMMTFTGSHTTWVQEWVSYSSQRTHTSVWPWIIDTLSTWMTGWIFAFIDVKTTRQIRCETTATSTIK